MKLSGLPCYTHPTTVLLLDDDEKYLTILEDSVEGSTQAFTKPAEAIRFLDQSPLPMEIHLSNIHSLREQPERLQQIATLIVDYQMPGMNGVEFCKQIRDHHPCKIIMLTGEATHALAVNAFNEGYIDRFVQKSTPHLYRVLAELIEAVQFSYFQDRSLYILQDFLSQKKPVPWFLQNEVCASVIQALFKKKQISEYYLLNEQGDFILLNQNGETLYFSLRDQHSWNEMLKLEIEPIYLEDPTPEATKQYRSIERKEQIPFLPLHQNNPDFIDWPLYPLQHEECEGQVFYYAWVNV